MSEKPVCKVIYEGTNDKAGASVWDKEMMAGDIYQALFEGGSNTTLEIHTHSRCLVEFRLESVGVDPPWYHSFFIQIPKPPPHSPPRNRVVRSQTASSDLYQYPEEHQLELIREWDAGDPLGLMNYVRSRWWNPDWGWDEKDKPSEITGSTVFRVYNISTGGWSGNEMLMEALQRNRLFWFMHWQESRRGGHYILKVALPPV